MRHSILFFIIVCQTCFCFAQHAATTTFTTENGLPSNVIYQCLEDDKGFLWVATDQGIARFDGKNFQVYAKEQGVPDIEVFQIEKEKNGRIWIRCYNNSVAYFNPVKNKFIEVTPIAELLHIHNIMKLIALPEGGIQFDTDSGSFLFNEDHLNGHPLRCSFNSTFIIKTNTDGTEFKYSYNEKNNKDSAVHIYQTKGNTILAERSLGFLGRELYFSVDENSFYIFKRKSTEYTVVSDFANSIQSISVKKHSLVHEYYVHNFTDRYLNILYRTKDILNGKDVMEVNVYDKKTCKFLFCLNENFIAFHMLNDSKGNLWVSTVDKGLVVYKTPARVTQCLQQPYNQINFYSVTVKTDGTILAGNEKGEIIEIKNDFQQVHKVFTTSKIEWQRNIILSQNKIVTFSDGGIFVNYQREIKSNAIAGHQESKVVLNVNDSIIMNGSRTGLCKLNTITEQIQSIDIGQKVVTGLASIDKQHIYIGSTDGLHMYDVNEHTLIDLNQTDALLRERIVAMCTTKDSLLWIATATNGIVVLKNNKVIQHIRETDGLSSNNSFAIIAGKEQQIWLGTIMGVCRLNYSFEKNRMNVGIQNISMIDGLTSNIVNQLFYDHNKVFVATEKGVCMIPDSIPIPNIKVELVGVQINQRDTILASDYSLKANQKNITLQFTGVDLRGYFKQVDYSQDKGSTWTHLEGGTLSLEKDNGEYTIWVRAVDVNKNVGKQILKLRFDIATPYWKAWWFWVIVTIFIQLVIAFIFYRRQKIRELEKRKIELAKAHLASLEQQAFVSLMNPHFMFNALNSIQHYINNQDRQNANRFLSDFASLIRKNFEAAQQAFIPLEQEMENIGLYLRLEKMRFNDKFTFEVMYDDDLDPDDWMMPTMILQPLVENSILHGIMPSQIHCVLQLRLSLSNDDLLLEVIDNGIGVENSRAMKQGSTHRSRGMELIHKRLHALSFFSKQELKLIYTVPFDDEKNPGNKTSLLIPFDMYQAWRNAQRNAES